MEVVSGTATGMGCWCMGAEVPKTDVSVRQVWDPAWDSACDPALRPFEAFESLRRLRVKSLRHLRGKSLRRLRVKSLR